MTSNNMGIPFVAIFLIGFLLLPLAWFWYLIKQQQYFWEQTYFDKARFRFPITFWGYVKLKLGNFFLLVLTLGLAWPWALIRNIRFVLDNLTLKGQANLDAIVQDSQSATPTGEGLDSFLDTGFEFG